MLVCLERFKETLKTASLVWWERGNSDVQESEALVQPTSTRRILVISVRPFTIRLQAAAGAICKTLTKQDGSFEILFFRHDSA